ncbi:OLC1v1038459C1 [Oldenlandia corymbosa var. corymbosa]|uniref:OLC1v1038459C1 n=1 Tax=Oldenlandia corymbosa var. corymbosa TaxID=529605 RepID=A0AAV1D0H5_OLDCO|nr:OLC1v1038459C1 [Oldenlandia corymbosa var. corymbosa]
MSSSSGSRRRVRDRVPYLEMRIGSKGEDYAQVTRLLDRRGFFEAVGINDGIKRVCLAEFSGLDKDRVSPGDIVLVPAPESRPVMILHYYTPPEVRLLKLHMQLPKTVLLNGEHNDAVEEGYEGYDSDYDRV